MRIRSFRPRSRRSTSPWHSRLAWTAIIAVTVLFVVLIVRNLRRHDALTEWRQNLEAAVNSPAWPEWSSAWPPLPDPPRRRHQLPQDLRGVYAYAAANSEVLAKIPCYCGCVREGHGSNLNCFVSGFRADGAPIWTDHSYSCPMCVHIAREVMLMTSQGMPISRIRREIDARYREQGSPTNTPAVN